MVEEEISSCFFSEEATWAEIFMLPASHISAMKDWLCMGIVITDDFCEFSC